MSQLGPGALFASRFEIEQAAGVGGTGTVYRARDRFTGETVALKLLHSATGPYQESERFAREAQLLAELRHPGIVSYITHGQTADGQCYLAMEWLEGVDLAQRLQQKGRLSIRDSQLVLRGVTEALTVAHRRSVIHRDLKPTNLYLPGSRVEHIKILDFGIARRFLTMAAVTRTGMLVGTPAYMAPEQAHGARQITLSADVFSLGCVVYECLTGQPPFIADHVSAVLARVLFDEPRPVRELRPEIPEALGQLIGRMLIKDPGQRIADAMALLDELQTVELAAQSTGLTTIHTQTTRPIDRAGSDQVLVNVILASPRRSQPGQTAQTFADLTVSTPNTPAPPARQTLVSALSELAAPSQWLLDGSLVVTLAAHGNATDQVARAAQVALTIKRHWPEAQVVLTTGLGAAGQNLLMGSAIDSAAQLLRQREATLQEVEHSAAPGPSESGVWLDDLSARLLDRYYVLTSSEGAPLLTDEQLSPDESRPLLGKPTMCVGREQELSMLDVVLSGCIEESHASVVLITAPAGLGKSRLRHEFLRRVAARSSTGELTITVLQGRAELMSKGAPYAMLAQALRRLCGILPGQDILEQRQRLQERLRQCVPASEQLRLSCFIGELCGVPFPEELSPQLRAARSDPKIMNDQITQAFGDFVRAECEPARDAQDRHEDGVGTRALIIVLEDLHWGDSLTINLLDAVLRRHSDQPLMVVALARPEVHEQFPRLWKNHSAQEMALKALSRKACERLIHQALGKSVGTATIENLVRLSTGSPLFLEELIRVTAESPGAKQPNDQPATVLAILQARLSHLDPAARRVLRAASIFGQTFWCGGVTQILESENDSGHGLLSGLERWFEHLLVLEYIEKHTHSRFDGEPEYSFRHSLMREAAYTLLTETDRRRSHLIAAEYLRRVGEGEALIIAEHYQRGSDADSAGAFYRIAAEQCYERHDLEGMLRRAQLGLACGASGAVRGELLAIACVAHHWRMEWALAIPTGEEAVELLPLGSLWWCRAIQQLFFILPSYDRPERLLELIALFSRARPADDAQAAYSAAAAHLILLTALMGDRDHSLAFLIFLEQVAMRSDSELLIRAWSAYAQTWFAHSLEAEPYLAFVSAQDACSQFAQAQAQHGLAQALLVLALAQAHLGALDEGIEKARTAYSMAQGLKDPFLTYWCQVNLALLLSRHTNRPILDEATVLARQALTDVSDPGFRGIARCALARALWRCGDAAQATAVAGEDRQALGMVRLYALAIDTTLIEALVAQGEVAEACGVAERGLAMLAELGGAGWSEVPLRVAASCAFAAAGQIERAQFQHDEARHQVEQRAERISDPEWRTRYLTLVEENVHALS